MRNVTISIVLLALTAGALAGCTSSESSALQDAKVQASMVLPLRGAIHYGTCSEVAGSFPVPTQLLAGVAPSGWTLVTDQTGDALLQIYTDDCHSAAANGTIVDQASEMWGTVVVDPPAAFKAAGIDSYRIVLGGMISNKTVANVYKAWGFGQTVGAADIFTEISQNAASRVSRSTGTQGSFSVDMTSTAAGLEYRFGVYTQRDFIVEKGNVTGAIDALYMGEYTFDTAGTATANIMGDTQFPLPAEAYAGSGFQYWGFDLEAHPVMAGHFNSTSLPAHIASAPALR